MNAEQTETISWAQLALIDFTTYTKTSLEFVQFSLILFFLFWFIFEFLILDFFSFFFYKH